MREPAVRSEKEIDIKRVQTADTLPPGMVPGKWPPRAAEASAAEAAAVSAVASAGIQDHASECVIGVAVTVGEPAIVSYANAAFRRLAGTEDRQVIGRPFFDAFPSLSNEHVRSVLSSVSLSGGESKAEIAIGTGAEDFGLEEPTHNVVLTASPIRANAAGGSREIPAGVLVQMHDTTGAHLVQPQSGRAGDGSFSDQRSALDGELVEVNQRLVIAALHEQELKEQAEAASNAKSMFLATMSHELRTPLNAIIGYASLLDAEIWGPIVDEQHKHLERLKSSAQHLLGLINDVLTLTRVEADKEIVYNEEVDTESLLEEVVSLTMPLAMAKHLNFRVQPGQAFTMRSDRGKLRQILVNLISNAIKFTNEGEVVMGAAIKNGEAEFFVTDTGIGIAPADFDHVFDMFWQVDQVLTRRVGGTGLGLNVSRRLAWLLGGRLDVTSKPGEGSTFTLHVPITLISGATES